MNAKTVSLVALGVSSTFLTACSADLSTGVSKLEDQGYSFETPEAGVHLMSKDVFNACGSWTPYNKVFEDERTFDEVYYCTGEIGFPLYLYRGVFALNLDKLITSTYYTSQGLNRSDVYLDENFKNYAKPVYENYAYTEELYEDPLARFDESLDETQTEGVLATQEDIDARTWTESETDPNVLVSDTDDTLMYMGVMFATMALMNNSSYYNSKGRDTSSVAVPASYMAGRSNLGYSNGSYYSDKGNIKSSQTRVQSNASRSESKAGISTNKSGSASVKSGTTSGGRGSGGMGSGARGGGAS